MHYSRCAFDPDGAVVHADLAVRHDLKGSRQSDAGSGAGSRCQQSYGH